MNCPSFEQLIDFLDRRLDEADAAAIATHTTSCSACADVTGWYGRVRGITASDDSIAPPSWVLKRAVRIFDSQRRSSPGLTERIGQVIASLVFDSFARPALAGVRSTETANRQLLYRAGDYSVDLQIARAEHWQLDLIGQVLEGGQTSFESVSGLKLDITRGGGVVFSAVTDEMGEFNVSGIEPGVYDLRVQLPEGSITLPDVPISES